MRILPEKREPTRMRALEGGRDDLQWARVRGIRAHMCYVLAGKISVARRLRWAVPRDDVSQRWRKRGYFSSRNRLSVSIARPDCRETGSAMIGKVSMAG
jgi:hypothetical protein